MKESRTVLGIDVRKPLPGMCGGANQLGKDRARGHENQKKQAEDIS